MIALYLSLGLFTAAFNLSAGKYAWGNLGAWPLTLPVSAWAAWKVDRYRRLDLDRREEEAAGADA